VETKRNAKKQGKEKKDHKQNNDVVVDQNVNEIGFNVKHDEKYHHLLERDINEESFRYVVRVIYKDHKMEEIFRKKGIVASNNKILNPIIKSGRCYNNENKEVNICPK